MRPMKIDLSEYLWRKKAGLSSMKYANVAILVVASTAIAEELRDPRTRDEDISSASLLSKIEKVNDKYRYLYTVTLPEQSIGSITSLSVDVACRSAPAKSPEKTLGGNGLPFYTSTDGRNVSVAVRLLNSEKPLSAGINARNEAMFNMYLMPGASRLAEIVSAAKPGYRHYSINASSRNEYLYDYSNIKDSEFEYDDPTLPMPTDWEVHGLTRGPACEGEEANPLTRPIFDGQRVSHESWQLNQLLRYEVPGNRNRWHAPASQTEVKIRVYYAENIDASSFTATLNGRDISNLFKPGKVHDEWVVLPLEGARSSIRLSVHEQGARNDEGQLGFITQDLDLFEIRRPVPSAP